MKLLEILSQSIGLRTLSESDTFIAEMANFLSDVTELPANIVLWTKPQPEELPHTKYRMKVYKDRIHCATFSVGTTPLPMWEINRNKLKLDAYEINETKEVIKKFSSLFIQYIDRKITTDNIKYEIKKLKGEK